MRTNLQPPLDGLAAAWARAPDLSPSEMGRLYLDVREALRHYRPLELQALPDGHEELIAQFIERKVLRLGRGPRPAQAHESAPATIAALRCYYRRYLMDCLRHSEQRLRVHEAVGVHTNGSGSGNSATRIESNVFERMQGWIRIDGAVAGDYRFVVHVAGQSLQASARLAPGMSVQRRAS